MMLGIPNNTYGDIMVKMIFFIAFLIIGGIVFKYFGNVLHDYRSTYNTSDVVKIIENMEPAAAGGRK
jgi:hypothetical protein